MGLIALGNKKYPGGNKISGLRLLTLHMPLMQKSAMVEVIPLTHMVGYYSYPLGDPPLSESII